MIFDQLHGTNLLTAKILPRICLESLYSKSFTQQLLYGKVCKSNVARQTILNVFFTYYQNQCSYGHSEERLFNVRFPAARDRYSRFITGFQYFMTWRFERGTAFSILELGGTQILKRVWYFIKYHNYHDIWLTQMNTFTHPVKDSSNLSQDCNLRHVTSR